MICLHLIMIMKTLGEFIREKRSGLDYSLREFARKIECSPAFLSDIELGKRNPSDELFSKIAEKLEIPLVKLKEYDARPLKKGSLTDAQSTKYSFAFRKVVETKIDPDELIKFIEKNKRK